MTLTFALVGAAISVGAVHTCAPDHWMPFAALARAGGWSARRTAAITATCGLGHVTVSVLLGLLALVFGRQLLEAFGQRLESLSGLLLIGFGAAYATFGLHNAVTAHVHGHAHGHGGHHRQLTPIGLFVLFSADPCVAVIPLMFVSAPLGWASTLLIVAAYELATIATMVLLVLPAHAAADAVRAAWADRYGDALAGVVVALVGMVVVTFGI